MCVALCLLVCMYVVLYVCRFVCLSLRKVVYFRGSFVTPLCKSVNLMSVCSYVRLLVCLCFCS